MNELMHDLIAAVVDRRASALTGSTAFADAHRGRVLRSIRARRAASYGGTGAAAAVLVVGAGFGARALSQHPVKLFPAGQPSPDSSIPIPSISPGAPSLANQVSTALVPFPLDEAYAGDATDRIYVFYVTLGATNVIPFPSSGIWYPGIPDVPSDAIIVSLNGDADGYDLTAPGSGLLNGNVWPASTAQDIGDANMFDVIGDVTSSSLWGIRFYLVHGSMVSVEAGRSSADAIEVTAMIGGDRSATTPEHIPTQVATTLVQVPQGDAGWGDSRDRSYLFYASAGATESIPFPSPVHGPMPDIPSDAVIVQVDGDTSGFNLVMPGSATGHVWAHPAWTDERSMIGNLDNYDFQWTEDGHNASITWDAFGEIHSDGGWGIHYFLVDGNIVTEAEGRVNPDAVEVTAMFDPASFTAAP
jgi:hypothetical protein